jgi:hypothetical protein
VHNGAKDGSMMDRRLFLGSAAATAAFFAMHDAPLMGAQLAGTTPSYS